ncbi:uncharacterized protein [Dysidea avara]
MIPHTEKSQVMNTSFVYEPQNTLAHLGSSNETFLVCIATGTGTLSYTWFKDGNNISDSNGELHIAANGHILYITEITADTQGEYTCVVESETGEVINSSATFGVLVAPTVADGVKASDIYVKTGKPIFLVLPCLVSKKSFPPPDVLWLRNGVPVDNTLFNATFVSSNFSLILTSKNTSYDFVYEHIIGMYQCFVKNEAGHTVTSSRVVFIYKPNPVASPLLHEPRCDNDDCSSFGLPVEWNSTDYYHSSLSQINYIVYLSHNGDIRRVEHCTYVHGTTCIIQMNPIVLGNYAVYVETVWDVQQDIPPEKASEWSKLSNTVVVTYSDIPEAAIKPCAVYCNSSVVDHTGVQTAVFWDLCPRHYNTVDSYDLKLKCTDPSQVHHISLQHTISRGYFSQYQFHGVPCNHDCNLVVIKNSVNFGNTSATASCGRTPKLRPQQAAYNVTAKRTGEVGTKVKVSFQIPPGRQLCYLPFSNMILRWSTPNDDSIYTKSYLENSAGVATTYDQLVHIDVTLDDLHRWKDVDFSVSFNTSAGFSPWSDSVRVSKVSNRDVQKDDIKFTVSSNPSTITIHWNLGERAESMVRAGFITGFQYFINEGGEERMHMSNLTSHTFSNLTAGHTYSIHGKVVTTDTLSEPVEEYSSQPIQLPNGPIQPSNYNPSPSDTSNSFGSAVIIAIIVCVTILLLVLVIVIGVSVYRCKRKSLEQDQQVIVSHHRQGRSASTGSSSTNSTPHSDIPVPDTPSNIKVIDWMKRTVPAGSDGVPTVTSDGDICQAPTEECPSQLDVYQVPTDLNSDNVDQRSRDDINYMLAQITDRDSEPKFVLAPVPDKARRSIHSAELYHQSALPYTNNNNTAQLIKTVPPTPGPHDDDSGYPRLLASNAAASGGSKRDSVVDKKGSNNEMAKLFEGLSSSSPSPVSLNKIELQDFSTTDHLPRISLNNKSAALSTSSTSFPYVENVENLPTSDSPYIENNKENVAHLISQCTDETPETLPSNSSDDESCSVYKGGYITEEKAKLLGSSAGDTIQSNTASDHQVSSNAPATDSLSTSEFGVYVSYNEGNLVSTMGPPHSCTTMMGKENESRFMTVTQNVDHLHAANSKDNNNTTESQHGSSVDSDCINFDDSPVDV